MSTLYQLPLPLLDNQEHAYHANTRRAFLDCIANEAGGYTMLPNSVGFWRDPESGKDYVDQVAIVQFAITGWYWKRRAALRRIEAAFHRLYVDQISGMVACIGSASFF